MGKLVCFFLRLFGLRLTTILQKKIVQMVCEMVVLGVSF